ncbi:DUF3325 domain-containing protein [Acinetobacter gerneri]|uniref:DUF3325 domain-containing protein n=1 Tax=Acinetobacter gerneri TaxID=202952 RepID=A0AAW8JDZ1_9GAMM|nr:DUF3325 domain-containing protein [Acinetobacter gerneri]MDQ9009776.1 DUF3325 domain-containing protein [Acinetobacter gerneri]MDQ9013982.1 DUF3325 domain-containing protein [Acinetobacter gerneri]MDQ9023563.1 DUF3325 domain-containing protein [Acinetobacter gerneri]MDQ9052439.1 DUF3325 domain-containing protein [Acinetobacter gerneri]MDQ9060052.1 DUF3325 domain-containing protein [Acinetobacter gerneri]
MIWFLLIWSLSTLGFFALASTMSKHQKQIFKRELAIKHTVLAKVIGWLLLIISLVLCVKHFNLSTAISYWIGVLSFSALFVAWCLSYAENQIKKIIFAPIILSCMSLIMLLSFSS